MVGFLPEANHRILTALLRAIHIFKTRALNAVSIHKHFKELLRSYKNLGYLVEIPQCERGRDRLLGVLHNSLYPKTP